MIDRLIGWSGKTIAFILFKQLIWITNFFSYHFIFSDHWCSWKNAGKIWCESWKQVQSLDVQRYIVYTSHGSTWHRVWLIFFVKFCKIQIVLNISNSMSKRCRKIKKRNISQVFAKYFVPLFTKYIAKYLFKYISENNALFDTWSRIFYQRDFIYNPFHKPLPRSSAFVKVLWNWLYNNSTLNVEWRGQAHYLLLNGYTLINVTPFNHINRQYCWRF